MDVFQFQHMLANSEHVGMQALLRDKQPQISRFQAVEIKEEPDVAKEREAWRQYHRASRYVRRDNTSLVPKTATNKNLKQFVADKINNEQNEDIKSIIDNILNGSKKLTSDHLVV
jgi:hypothetical protein